MKEKHIKLIQFVVISILILCMALVVFSMANAAIVASPTTSTIVRTTTTSTNLAIINTNLSTQTTTSNTEPTPSLISNLQTASNDSSSTQTPDTTSSTNTTTPENTKIDTVSTAIKSQLIDTPERTAPNVNNNVIRPSTVQEPIKQIENDDNQTETKTNPLPIPTPTETASISGFPIISETNVVTQTISPQVMQSPVINEQKVSISTDALNQIIDDVSSKILPNSDSASKIKSRIKGNIEMKIESAKESLDIKKELRKDSSENQNNDISVVSIVIKPKGNSPVYNVSLIEEIPKEIANSAKDIVFYGDVKVTVIKDDPLIMWHIAVVTQPVTVTYAVKTTDSDILDKTGTVAMSDNTVKGNKQMLQLALAIGITLAVVVLVVVLKLFDRNVKTE